MKWDVFISHAWEDKETVARPLARKLKEQGLRVWFDEDVLQIGDSLFRSINDGLANSSYGIVILSRNFFAKDWPQRELSALYQLATATTKVILPVWHDVSREQVASRYPMLADLVSVQSTIDLDQVVAKLLPVIKREPSQPPDSSLESVRRYLLEELVKEATLDDSRRWEWMVNLRKIEPAGDGWFHQELRKRVLGIMRDPLCLPGERVRAGNALAQLGDSRFRPDAWFLPGDGQLGFVQVPDGSFYMGSDQEAVGRTALRESPQRLVYVPTYYMARYPVTVAQYHAFTHPGRRQDVELAGLENHPVVSVSWYEARGYCDWLTDRLREWTETPEPFASLLSSTGGTRSWVITLPSEAEWEKAARGMDDALVYPWGSLVDVNRANFQKTGVGTTSPVGCFEKGRSPYGLQDMSGNIWEWTRSNWGTNVNQPLFGYPYQAMDGREDIRVPEKVLRVIRGGSFCSPSEDIRCSCREGSFPNTKHDHIGFRLALTCLSP